MSSDRVISIFNELVRPELGFSFQEWRKISMILSNHIAIPILMQDRLFQYAHQAGHSVETHFNSYPTGSPIENSVGYHMGMITSYIWQSYWGLLPMTYNMNSIYSTTSRIHQQNRAIYEATMRKTAQHARELMVWEEDLQGISCMKSRMNMLNVRLYRKNESEPN